MAEVAGWRALLILAIGAAVIVSVVVLRSLGGGEGRGTFEGPGASFTIEHPDGWGAVSAKMAARLETAPLAVLQSDDEKGFVFVRRVKGAPQSLASFTRRRTRALNKQYPDFSKGRTGFIRTRAGDAFYYLYNLPKAKQTHLDAMVPFGSLGDVMSGVNLGESERIDGDIREIIQSFDL